MRFKKNIILFLVLIFISEISFASETTNATKQVNQIINSPQGIQLYNLEVEISIQKKQNELLKLKEEAIKMQKEIENTSNPPKFVSPPIISSYQFPEKGYFAPSTGFQETYPSMIKQNKLEIFQVMMVEKGINALIKKNREFYFVKVGDKLNGAKVIRISGYGITLDKDGTNTFYPVSVIMPNNNQMPPQIVKK